MHEPTASQYDAANPYATPATATRAAYVRAHRGVLILTFGLLGILFCPFLGLPAWVMSNRDLAEMDAGLMDPEGRALTQVGKVCGIVSAIFLCLWAVMFVFQMLILFLAITAHAR